MVIFTCYQSEPIYTISTLTRYELPQTKDGAAPVGTAPTTGGVLITLRYRVWPQPEHFSPIFTFS